jgi:hypothetical protein
MSRCDRPIDLARCLDYWLGELPASAEEDVEAHMLGCVTCSERIAGVADFAIATRTLVAQGALRAVLTPAFVATLRASGLQVREYQVPRNGHVYCTVAPGDDVMIATLEFPVVNDGRIDLVMQGVLGEGEERLRDVPYEPASGRVVISPPIAPLRLLGTTTARIRLLAVNEDGERELGSYTFFHRPYAGSARR